MEGSGGIPLAVHERGPADGSQAEATVLLVHGYPDDHSVWDSVADRLAERFHVVSYDVRGAGESGVPQRTAGYRFDHLAGDAAAVLDATAPNDRLVHLVGHDWGSIQGWHFVCEATLAHRFASFISVSGPQLDAVGGFFRGQSVSAPTPRTVLSQAAKSWYVAAFHIPWIAPAFWRSRLSMRAWPRVLAQVEGLPPERLPNARKTARTQLDGAHGVGLYRANMLRSVGRARRRTTSVPVQVVVPTRDRYVSPELAEVALDVADETVFVQVDAGHWLPLSDPDLLAVLVTEHIDRVSSNGSNTATRAATTHTPLTRPASDPNEEHR